MSEAPPPRPGATATTLGRPGAASTRSTSRPASPSQPATKSAISSSPAPPGTRSGFTESIETSSATSCSALIAAESYADDIYNRLVICGAMAAYAALAEPHRRQILDLLRERERSVNDLVARLDISQPGVSKHLKVLRESGLVEVRPEGRQRWYGLRAQPLAEVDQWLQPYREYWSGRLDALELHLEENPE